MVSMKALRLILVTFCGWVFPGGGHLVIREKRKAILFFAIVVITFNIGFALAAFRAPSWSLHPFHFLGQCGCGLVLLVSWISRINPSPEYFAAVYDSTNFEIGTLYIAASGLLNLIILINAISLIIRRKTGQGK